MIKLTNGNETVTLSIDFKGKGGTFTHKITWSDNRYTTEYGVHYNSIEVVKTYTRVINEYIDAGYTLTKT